jgi:ubiquinone/menaquinone biosynthesis C-methylase UbiE
MLRFDKYEKYGAYHWKSIIFNQYSIERRYQIILKQFRNKRGSLLDVGCGDGALSYLLSKKGLKVTGIDINEKGIAFAKSRTKNVAFETMDPLNIKEKFDYVICVDTLEHIPNYKKYVNKMLKIAKNEVILLIPLYEKDIYDANYFTPKQLKTNLPGFKWTLLLKQPKYKLGPITYKKMGAYMLGSYKLTNGQQ